MGSLDSDLFDIFQDYAAKENESGSRGALYGPKADRMFSQTTGKRKAEQLGDDTAKKTKNEGDVFSVEVLPRLQTHTVETFEACTHEVVVPCDSEYVLLKPPTGEPAKVYPFALDPFQKEALLCLENNQSVLVSAHTSAGKTVVAVYAIAMSLRSKQRVIYTTPIKALSNQKYRELYEEFTDVGLMTGDVTINPTASCLVMTTEILRDILYHGFEMMRKVAWVVFDDINYMRDKEYASEIEEAIILLPEHTPCVFLSALMANALQFAEWMSLLHKKQFDVIYTSHRPIPQQVYIFPVGGDCLHLVVGEDCDFSEANFNMAMSQLRDAGFASKEDQRGLKGGIKGNTSDFFELINLIIEKKWDPVIVFSYSRRNCEAQAREISKLNFTSYGEKTSILKFVSTTVNTLSDEDKKLPQVEHILPLIKKGIAVYNSDLLPVLREMMEILFSKGLIKVLFATENINVRLISPARTVLITSCRKFDGHVFKKITSGEYIQMSGRAGRRGLDERGIVIMMVDERISPDVGKVILKGEPDALNSAFHLTYNTVLNLLRKEITPEYMLERSFYQFQNSAAIPELLEKLQQKESAYKALDIDDEDSISAYYHIQQQLDSLTRELKHFIVKPIYLLPFLQPGRVVKVKKEDLDFGWGVVLKVYKKMDQSMATDETGTLYIVEVLLNLTKDSLKSQNPSDYRPCPKGEKGEMQVVPILTLLIEDITKHVINLPHYPTCPDGRRKVLKSLQLLQHQHPADRLKLLDPIKNMGIEDQTLRDIIKRKEALENCLFSHRLHKDRRLPELYGQFEQKAKIATNIKEMKLQLKKRQSSQNMDVLWSHKQVLRTMQYCSPFDVIEVKGKVACEINRGNELLLTELILKDIFKYLSSQQACALLSCLVCQEQASQLPKMAEILAGPLIIMQDTARHIARINREAKLELDEEPYDDSFSPHMMDVIFEWCSGASFAMICSKTGVFEGSIIQAMRQLEEILREMVQAAKVIGNTDLEKKFTEGIRQIKRDCVFTPSLYL